MWQRKLISLLIILVAGAIGYFTYTYGTFRLGLDLRGGSHLVYEADTAALPAADISEAMSSLREVIERRINAFGVAEPLIQVEEAGLGAEAKHRLIVELPGVTNLEEAIKLINITPQLEFRVLAPGADLAMLASSTASTSDLFVSSGLTGRYLKHASVQFDQQSINPTISVEFNDEGSTLFAKVTQENVGKPVGIFLDGALISAPSVREAITSGQAQISGQFTVDEARSLARNLNLGALPVPISLISTETIGPTLGAEALAAGLRAGLLGLSVVALFMLLWYRLPGLVSVVSLAIYAVLMLAVFKLFGVTLTAAGIAGFILSVGMALDANVLIFERLKEEIRAGKDIHEAIREGFSRAWFAIRDSNLSSIISAIVLFWFGTALIKGFALTLLLGIVVSMFTAITVTRTLLLSVAPKHKKPFTKFLFSSGLNIK
ncbi:MAG: protein translocase subunit SecD [Patescibacteria group bacterium]